LPIELEDAEQPSVSADARWLGFIREDNGRGTLWIVTRDVAMPRGTEVELAGPGYDVREFGFFPDGRIVMASSTASGPRLFVTGPTPGPVVALPTSVPRARYPAVSPDGRWLAYSGQEHGAWQLRLMDLDTHGEERLTHADCNSIAPAWTPDSASLVYASDCGRNIGNTALFRVRVPRRSDDYGHPPWASPNSSSP
jgi:Tol biopolymer transport system component